MAFVFKFVTKYEHNREIRAGEQTWMDATFAVPRWPKHQ
jgi:hypothetical protein